MVQMRINHEEKRMTKKNTYKMIAAMSMLLLVGSVLSAGIASAAEKPNIVVIWGDDIGESNISAYSFGVMGYKTPNIDRLSKEGMMLKKRAMRRDNLVRTTLVTAMSTCPQSTDLTSSLAISTT